MKETKHSPGPWSTYLNTIDDIVIRRLNSAGYETATIGRVRTGHYDARLIAAAPDLLEALQEAELVLAEKLRRLGADPNVSPTTHRIRAAIAKATGDNA